MLVDHKASVRAVASLVALLHDKLSFPHVPDILELLSRVARADLPHFPNPAPHALLNSCTNIALSTLTKLVPTLKGSGQRVPASLVEALGVFERMNPDLEASWEARFVDWGME